MVDRPTHVLNGAVIEIRPHGAACTEAASLLEQGHLVDCSLLEFVPLGIAIRCLSIGTRLRTRFGDIHHVSDPGGNRLDENLRALLLKESEHIEVAVAFGRLSPELARDFDDWLGAQTIDFNGVDAIAARMKRVNILLA